MCDGDPILTSQATKSTIHEHRWKGRGAKTVSDTQEKATVIKAAVLFLVPWKDVVEQKVTATSLILLAPSGNLLLLLLLQRHVAYVMLKKQAALSTFSYTPEEQSPNFWSK